MNDIKDPRLLWIKGGLFVLLGSLAFGLVILQSGSITVTVAALIAIWAFCRAYYFAFYVVEHYIDGEYRFAGLTSVFYYWRRERIRLSSTQQSVIETTASLSHQRFAVRIWIALLLAPFAYWLARNGWSRVPLSNQTHTTEMAVAAAWLGILGFWIVRGSFPLPWRCLIGFSAGAFACLLFSSEISFAELMRTEGAPLDLRVLADGLGYFSSTLLIHYAIAIWDRKTMRDQLCPSIENQRTGQVSIRFLLCLMTVSVLLMLVLTRTYSWGLEATVNPRSVFRAFIASIPCVLLTYLTAKTTLGASLRSHSFEYQSIVVFILVSPLMMLTEGLLWGFDPTAGTRLLEFYLLECGMVVEYWCITFFVMFMLRRSHVVMRGE